MSKQRDHSPSWKIVGQGERPTKRVGIYARVDDAQGLELSEVPVDYLGYPVPIPVHDNAFRLLAIPCNLVFLMMK